MSENTSKHEKYRDNEAAGSGDRDETRLRLLESAGIMFAERGFRLTTVRDICEAAEANVAAVNYHFGDKERLYIETVKHAYAACTHAVPMPEWPADLSPRDRLADFVRVCAARMLGDHTLPWQTALLMRELADPSQACAEWVRDYIRPMAHTLKRILEELLPHTNETERWMIGFSIVGQCLFYRQNRPIVVDLLKARGHVPPTPAEVGEHVVRLVLTALDQFRAGGWCSPPEPSAALQAAFAAGARRETNPNA